MWDVNELFVLSDLHLAAERNSGLFQADAELAACLNWIVTETRDSLTVLAGDVLDFLQLSDGETQSDLRQFGDRTCGIIKHHPEVFDALAKLACSPRHRLVIMGGDHDPELIFPMVQETVERRLGLDFINSTIRWLVEGEALRVRVGKAAVLIEHGHVLDSWNNINYATLKNACSLVSRNLSDISDYQPPLGSRLVLEVISELRRNYPWIDCLKPETEIILPLLGFVASRPQRKRIFSFASEYLSMKAFALNKRLGNLPNPERLYKDEKESDDTQKDQAFEDWRDAIYEQQQLTLDNTDKDNKLIKQLRMVSARDTLFESDKPDDSVRHLQPIFASGTDLVIHGHTHAAKAYPIERGFYINTGTWGQFLQLPKSYESDEVWQDFLDLLRTNDVNSFRRPTFARVQYMPTQTVTTATLLKWQQSGPKALTTQLFSDPQTGWRLAKG